MSEDSKKSILTSFGCAKHPKAGRNTQQQMLWRGFLMHSLTSYSLFYAWLVQNENVKWVFFVPFYNSFWPPRLVRNSVVTYMWLLLKRLLLLLLFLFPFPECLRMSPWCRAGWLWWTMVVGPPAPPVDKYGKHFVKYYNGILLFAEFCQSKLQSRLGTD